VSFPERLDSVRESDTLAATLVALRRRWLLVLGVTAACLMVAVVRHEQASKTYKATASVAFQGETLPDAALQVSSGGSSEPQRAADTEVLIAHSSQVAEGVRRELESSEDASELLKLVSVEAAPNADVLNIAATTHDSRYSARLSNAFAKQYIEFKTAAQVAGIAAAERKLGRQISTLPPGSAARTSLEQSQQRLAGLRAVAGGGANIISVATAPNAPAGLGLLPTAVIGIFVGLALSLAIVFLLEAVDRRVKTIEDFERAYRLPALAGVPQSSFTPAPADQRTALLEPYRILRSALDFAAVTRPLDSLLVTSAVPGEGKTTVAVDLAHAVALTGRNVVLAEFDLRRPTFARQFDMRAGDGFTNAILQEEGVAGLLRKPLDDLPNLSVLTSGRLPPNPSELLSAPSIGEILAELMSEDSFLIVDAPPLNPVADAQALLNNPLIHGVLIVARVNLTTREEVRRARAILDRHPAEPVGIAVTGLRDPGRYGYDPYLPISPPQDARAAKLSRPSGAAGPAG
jgi:polysaccharide biosynthesis transport protein